ncbi:NlpC/P60 family protein [Oerskovia sp. M15]
MRRSRAGARRHRSLHPDLVTLCRAHSDHGLHGHHRDGGGSLRPGFGERLRDRLDRRSLRGRPVRLWGTTPDGFDCSGFTQYVFAQLGISLPRTSGAQGNLGTKVSRADAQPGDLIWTPATSRSTPVTACRSTRRARQDHPVPPDLAVEPDVPSRRLRPPAGHCSRT